MGVIATQKVLRPIKLAVIDFQNQTGLEIGYIKVEQMGVHWVDGVAKEDDIKVSVHLKNMESG